MKHNSVILTLSAMLLASASGCGIGYNKTMFFTRSNLGIDIDTEPPTMEVTMARREAVISPTFEKGQTPPVLASFSYAVGGPLAFFVDVGSTFAGGDAAMTMASLYDDPDDPGLLKAPTMDPRFESELSVNSRPQHFDMWGNEDGNKKLLEEGEIEPFLFATDTSIGLKVAWSGATAQVPSTIKFGFNRKDFALAPVTIQEDKASSGYKVKMPSFLATVDHAVNIKSANKTGIKHLQYFATGKAADRLALRHGVRKAMAERLDPIAAEESSGFTEKATSVSAKQAFLLLGQLRMMRSVLEMRSTGQDDQPADSEATRLLAALDAAAPVIPSQYDVVYYKRGADGAPGGVVRKFEPGTRDFSPGQLDQFHRAIAYAGEILSVYNDLPVWLETSGMKLATPAGTDDLANHASEISADMVKIRRRFDEILRALNKNAALDDAAAYFKKQI